MKKRALILFTMILMLFVLASCGRSSAPEGMYLAASASEYSVYGVKSVLFTSDNQFMVSKGVGTNLTHVYYNYKKQGDKYFFAEEGEEIFFEGEEDYDASDYFTFKNIDKSRITLHQGQNEYDFIKVQYKKKSALRRIFGF